MTKITIDRSVVQQGLEALVQIYQRAATAETQALSDAVLLWSANADNTPESVRVEIQEVLWIRSSITNLRAALAQQAEPKGGGRLPPPLQAEPVQEPCEPLAVLKRALEIIAVGDSKNPQQDAADALVDIGFWSGEAPQLQPKAEPVQEPVAWSGYDLDGMVEAFSRVIEAHHSSKHPFHNPIDMDAKMALRILRGCIPAMKAYAAPPQRKPLTSDKDRPDQGTTYVEGYGYVDTRAVRAVERAHGIGGQP